MNESLVRWIGDADALRHHEHFRTLQIPVLLSSVRTRIDDYYISLVGELFEQLRLSNDGASNWSLLGNALNVLSESPQSELDRKGINRFEAKLFAAASFYCGGYPASAILAMRAEARPAENEKFQACFDFLARPSSLSPGLVGDLVNSLRSGDSSLLDTTRNNIREAAGRSFYAGPNEWIADRILEVMIERFASTNVRAVLPDGFSSFWNQLIESFLNETPPAWDFFPSQIQAIEQGLLKSDQTYSLQMPTGAGKTALCETLLYSHLKSNDQHFAIFLVPYRSLASELKSSLARRLNAMGISTVCLYGGTVPVNEVAVDLADARVMVATPESLIGLLNASPNIFSKISLVICDEGHLLDSESRGVALELLLAKLKTRASGTPRFVFISAIVPNIDEINTWLGGPADGVVRSEYRPALAEFARVKVTGSGSRRIVNLEMHPHLSSPYKYEIDRFLSKSDFQYKNARTQRLRTFAFESFKTLAIATARKALPLGASAVFAANKNGNQGAVGLAEELLRQLESKIGLPAPISFANVAEVNKVHEYLVGEYGVDWVGARVLKEGAVLHHGDIPQETREVLEKLLRKKHVMFVICTSTLAEGVNLPIRTLVLYSVRRRTGSGGAEQLLERDIKNLVGRAGRAGSTMKGLVITANDDEWQIVEPIARQSAGEPVYGALSDLISRLQNALANQNAQLTNRNMEKLPALHSLIDGIDAVLIEFATQEIGQAEFVTMAQAVAEETYAFSRMDGNAKSVLRDVFRLRAEKVFEAKSNGRLVWVKSTGARLRMLDVVDESLITKITGMTSLSGPEDDRLITALVEWSFTLPEVQTNVRDVFRLDVSDDLINARTVLINFIKLWISGATFLDISRNLGLEVNEVLRIHTSVIAFTLQTVIEQAVSLLDTLLLDRFKVLDGFVQEFPEHLRFGALKRESLILASAGLRHRSAAKKLGAVVEQLIPSADSINVLLMARELLNLNPEQWRNDLGDLVFENTIFDLEGLLRA